MMIEEFPKRLEFREETNTARDITPYQDVKINELIRHINEIERKLLQPGEIPDNF